ncbi:MAG: 50S ribosomal protein L9 [Proteobacteria bacterium]|nr:50S ribosomal protein L9 [Pseudomonadota bacterium]
MQIILLERIERLGQMGQLVNVKPGYARNFLLPKKKALRATKENIALFDKQRAVLEAHNLKRRQEAEEVAKTMENVMLTIVRQASEMGHLYGSVRVQDIVEGLKGSGYKVDRGQVELIRPIKSLGIHQAKIILHPEVSVPISINVAQSQEEAVAQADNQ